MIELTRTQILEGNYNYPSTLITLDPTNHIFDRMAERGINPDNLPSKVRVTKDNIHSAKTENGKDLNSVVIRLKYNMYTWVFIVVNPFDGGAKSIWVKKADRPIK